ncbi:MAG TPA: hypothetical protein VMW50_14015 [Dehalococcoidia bacterium]|nr:hypothetical protein [Dehalococcoidia bacterium]
MNMLYVGWIVLVLAALLNLSWIMKLDNREEELDERGLELDAYAGQLDDWAREIKVARTNLDNLVTHAERYAAGHEATRIMFNRIVERLHEKLPEEAEDGGD